MVTLGRRLGIAAPRSPGHGFARPAGHAIGNDLPANTGNWQPARTQPGPGSAWPGYAIDGNLGRNDGYGGPDPDAPQIQPHPRLTVLGEGQESWWRGGIQGFSDKLTVKDRHGYFDAGYQRTGTDFIPGSAPPNTYNNPIQEPPHPDFRLVNRTVSFQKGSDSSRNQDDLARPYTWLGEQGSGYSPVYGGTPGLYLPYGSRGGVPYPVHDPTNGQGGRETVWSGPPHGLHSETYPDNADTLARYAAAPQMRPVRIDRP